MRPRLLFATVAGLLAAGLLGATPPIPKSADEPKVEVVSIESVLPVTAELGKRCVVEVKTTAKKVTWRVPADVDHVLLTPDGKKLGVWALPGTYTLTAYAPAGDDVVVADVSVTITGGVPGPSPNAFLAELKAAYAKDTGTTKAVLVGKLAALYRLVGAGKDKTGVNDPTIKTYYDLHQDFAGANSKQMSQSDLQGVRTAIAKRLDANLSTSQAAPIDRTLAGTEYLAVAAALEALTK